MKDLNNRDFKHLDDTIKKVYQTLKEKKKIITHEQESGMYGIMQSKPSRRRTVEVPGGDMYGMEGGGYMNGARKKSKRRKSKRRKSKKRRSRRRKTKRRS